MRSHELISWKNLDLLRNLPKALLLSVSVEETAKLLCPSSISPTIREYSKNCSMNHRV